MLLPQSIDKSMNVNMHTERLNYNFSMNSMCNWYSRDVDSLQENRQLKTKEFDQGELSLSMPFWRGVQSSTQGRYVAS